MPLLAQLRALADDLGNGKTPPEEALARVRELAGDGALASAVASALDPGPKAGASLDDVLAGSARATASGAIDAVVRGMKPAAPAGGSKGARAARKAIEEVIYATAADALRDPAVTRMESAWRGLKLLADQCPASAAVAIEVVDVSPAGVPAALTAELAGEAVDQPDFFVVADACDDVAVLRKLAEEAEAALAPVLVAVSPKLFGATDGAGVAMCVEQPGGGMSEDWNALRREEPSRWLCAVTNRAVVVAEGQGARVAPCWPAHR